MATKAQVDAIKAGMDGVALGAAVIDHNQQKYIAVQADKTPDNTAKKALATKLAVNELKLNHWSSVDADYQLVYQTVFIEKLMFVEMSYNISEIHGLAEKLLSGQKQMIASLGLIVSRTGEILANQTIIITKLDEIKIVVDQVLVNTEIIITNTEEILAYQERFEQNGIKIRDDRANNGSGGGSSEKDNTLLYLGVGVVILVVAYYFMVHKK